MCTGIFKVFHVALLILFSSKSDFPLINFGWTPLIPLRRTQSASKQTNEEKKRLLICSIPIYPCCFSIAYSRFRSFFSSSQTIKIVQFTIIFSFSSSSFLVCYILFTDKGASSIFIIVIHR